MTSTDQARSTLLEELKWVHRLIRRDLQTCSELAISVANGAAPGEVREQLSALQTRGPLFQLRTNCLRYCTFVHAHHRHEDVVLFPAVREYAPTLGAVVDRLEADHRRVSDLLDAVEASAGQLGTPVDLPARRLLVDALDELSRHLLEHLAYEEDVLAPVLKAWDRWPFFG